MVCLGKGPTCLGVYKVWVPTSRASRHRKWGEGGKFAITSMVNAMTLNFQS